MKRSVRFLATGLRVGIAVALVAYLARSGLLDWSALTGLAANWPLTTAAFLLLLLCMVVTAWRLCVLLRPQGLQLSLASSVRLTLIGIFFSFCLPGATGGDAARIYYATAGHQGRRTEVTTVLLLDRAAGMFALLLWPLLFAPFFPGLLAASPVFARLLTAAALLAGAVALGVLVATSTSVRHHRVLVKLLRRMPLGAYAERILDTVHSYRRHRVALLTAVGISLLAHSLAVLVALIVASVTNPGGVAWKMAILIPLGFMANAVPITPGGLGVGEAAFSRLFSLAGLAGGAEVMLGWRFLLVLIGAMGLAVYLRGQSSRFVHAVEMAEPRDRQTLSSGRFGSMAPMPKQSAVNYGPGA